MKCNQWIALFEQYPISQPFLDRLLLCVHTPELGMSLLQNYYPQWMKEDKHDTIRLVIQNCHLSSLSNVILRQWIESLPNVWKDAHLVYKCMEAIYTHSFRVFLN